MERLEERLLDRLVDRGGVHVRGGNTLLYFFEVFLKLSTAFLHRTQAFYCSVAALNFDLVRDR